MPDRDLVRIIEDALNQTRKCEFKRAWIPRGWACVNIKEFSKYLARKLNTVG